MSDDSIMNHIMMSVLCMLSTKNLTHVRYFFQTRLLNGETRMDKESNENNENASCFPIASVHNISGDGGAPVILSNVQPVGFIVLSQSVSKQL